MLWVPLSFANRFVDQLQILQCHFSSSLTEKLSPELVTAHAWKCKKLYGDNSAQEALLGHGLPVPIFREDALHEERSELKSWDCVLSFLPMCNDRWRDKIWGKKPNPPKKLVWKIFHVLWKQKGRRVLKEVWGISSFRIWLKKKKQ